MAPEDLSLEKLKIHERLVGVERAVMSDKEDTKAFRAELKEMLRTQHTVLFGDGEAKKGLATRTTELETAQKIHARFAWTAITATMGVAIASLWSLLTGHKPN